MKAGWKTTEFYVSALAIVGLVTSALASSLSPKYAAIGAAISSAAYAISRGLAKLNHPAVAVAEIKRDAYTAAVAASPAPPVPPAA